MIYFTFRCSDLDIAIRDDCPDVQVAPMASVDVPGGCREKQFAIVSEVAVGSEHNFNGVGSEENSAPDDMSGYTVPKVTLMKEDNYDVMKGFVFCVFIV